MATKQRQYDVQYWPISRIIPYRRNPRKTDKAIPFVERSLIEFGWQKPILVDTDGVIIAGHVRWEAAKNLGMEEVPVHIASDLTEEQVKAYRIVDNRSSEFSEWDDDLLIEELEAIGDFDPELIGFDIQDRDHEDDPDIQPWDLFTVEDEYVVTIRGPLPFQDEVRERLKGMDNVTIEVSQILWDRKDA